MNAALITAAVGGVYVAGAMVTMRFSAWQSARRGERGRRGEEPLDEVIMGLVWPALLLAACAVAPIAGMHWLATRGIKRQVEPSGLPEGCVPPSTSMATPPAGRAPVDSPAKEGGAGQ